MESKQLAVYKSDLKKIGHTMHETSDDLGESTGKTSIYCDMRTCNIEEILLREILCLFGYKILSTNDILDDEDNFSDIEFITDMPWQEFNELMKS